MSQEVLTIPRRTPMRDAAGLLRRAGVSGAPVVDDAGRCVGVLSATDFLRWAEDGCPAPAEGPIPVCSYQAKGRLNTGADAILCTLSEGSCSLQEMHASTEGRRVAVCTQPNGVLCDWQQTWNAHSAGTVDNYMTSDVVTAGPRVPVAELARIMIDAHIHRILVLDEYRRPVGVVTSTDLLAELAAERNHWHEGT